MMTKDEALRLVQELEEFLVRAPEAGLNRDAEPFFRERCRLLKMAVPHNSECANVENWAGIYYSFNKWERYGAPKVREFLEKALGRVRAKTENYYKWIAD
jgi:hypothetical protein